MSGGYGFSGNRGGGHTNHTEPSYKNRRSSYNKPTSNKSLVTSGNDPRSSIPTASRPMSMRTDPIPPQTYTGKNLGRLGANHKVISTAKNVVIVALDMTGSMKEWPKEIIARGGLMKDKLAEMTGTEDNEFLFMGFGDGPLGDSAPIQVAPEFANDERLADHLKSLVKQRGFGNREEGESANLPIQYVLRMVDTMSAQNVYFFLVTDERMYTETQPGEIRDHFDQSVEEIPLDTKEAIQLLRRRMEVFCLHCNIEAGWDDLQEIEDWWVNMMGRECVLPVEYEYKVAETIVGVVATRLGKGQQFLKDLSIRHSGTFHGPTNIASVRKSISFVQEPGSSKAIEPAKRASILTIGK